MKKLIFSTNNRHKIQEVSEIFGENYHILSLEEIGVYTDIPETGKTLEENALIKVRYIYDMESIDCFADDTGLEVEALENAPGIHSARYAGEHKNSADNVNKLLTELAGKENRKASFRTVIAAIIHGKEYIFEGVVNGHITGFPSGNGGFGYDPVFVPEGCTKTFAEMDDKEKNKISHRALAVEKFRLFLEQH